MYKCEYKMKTKLIYDHSLNWRDECKVISILYPLTDKASRKSTDREIPYTFDTAIDLLE